MLQFLVFVVVVVWTFDLLGLVGSLIIIALPTGNVGNLFYELQMFLSQSDESFRPFAAC